MTKKQKHIELNNIEKGNIHKVPDQYFKKLNTDILNRIEEEKSVDEKKETPIIKLILPTAIAAVLALVYFVFWSPSSTTPADFNNLLGEVDTYDIIEYLEDTELTEEEILASVDVGILANELLGEDDILDQLDINESDIIEAIDDIDIEEYNM